MSEPMEYDIASNGINQRSRPDVVPSPFLVRFATRWGTNRQDFFVGLKIVLLPGFVIILCFSGYVFVCFIPIGIQLGFYWLSLLGWLACLSLMFILMLILIFLTLADDFVESMARRAYARITRSGTAIPALAHDLTEDEERIVFNDSLFNFLIGQPNVHTKFRTSYAERLKLLAARMTLRKAWRLKQLGSSFFSTAAQLNFLSPMQPVGKWWRFHIPRWQFYIVVLSTELAVKLVVTAFVLVVLSMLWLGIPGFEIVAILAIIVWVVRSTFRKMERLQSLAFEAAFFKVLSDSWPWEYEKNDVASRTE